jgi:hypothetical protein
MQGFGAWRPARRCRELRWSYRGASVPAVCTVPKPCWKCKAVVQRIKGALVVTAYCCNWKLSFA